MAVRGLGWARRIPEVDQVTASGRVTGSVQVNATLLTKCDGDSAVAQRTVDWPSQ